MQYIHLKRLAAETVDKGGEKRVSIPADLFRQLIASALQGKGMFDENYYLSVNSDIQDAVRRGAIESASEHYYTTGYFEGRLPKKLLVDEKFYLEANPDVAEAVRKGLVKDAQEHFENAGFREGRVPHKGFSLL